MLPPPTLLPAPTQPPLDKHAPQQPGASDFPQEPELLMRAYALGGGDKSKREQAARASRGDAKTHQPQVRQKVSCALFSTANYP